MGGQPLVNYNMSKTIITTIKVPKNGDIRDVWVYLKIGCQKPDDASFRVHGTAFGLHRRSLLFAKLTDFRFSSILAHMPLKL